MAVTQQQVAEVYVATFNRAPDAAGLSYWVNDSFGGDPTIEQIAASFFDQAETQALYPEGTTDEAFVTSIYQNLFNRAPDADGLAYWVGENGLGGAMTRDVMIEAMKNGATGDDATIIANKAEVGLYYASLGLDGTFSLASVTADAATVTAAKADADAALVAVTPASYTLATTTDILETTGVDTITGTSSTLNAADIISDNSTTDNDTLNLTLTTVPSAAATITNIENINVNINAFAGTATTFNATNVTGATITLSSTKLGYDGAAGVTAAAANTVVAGSNVTTLTVAGVNTGTVDAGSATTVNVDASATTVDGTVVVNGDVDVVAGAATVFDELTISAAAASDVDLTGSSAMTTGVIVEGAVDVTLSGAETQTAKTITNNLTEGTLTASIDAAGAVNASGWDVDVVSVDFDLGAVALTVATGANVAVTASQTALTVTGPSATTGTVTVSTDVDSTLLTFSTLASATLNATAALDIATLAMGTTAVTLNVAADTTVSTAVTGTGALTITGTGDVDITTGATATVDASGLTGALTYTTTVDADITGGSGANVITVGSSTVVGYTGGAGVDTVVATALTSGTLAAELGAGNDVVKFGAAITGVVALDGGAGTDAVNLASGVDYSGAGTWAVTNFEALTFTDAAASAVVAQTATLLGSQADDFTSLAFTGPATGTSDDTLVLTVNVAGASTSLANLVVASTDRMSLLINGVNGTAQTIVGTNAADTIDGGTGTATAGNTLTGGAGDDIFVFAASDSTAASMTAITDYQAAAAASDNDTLDIVTTTLSADATTAVSANAIFTGATATVNAVVANGVMNLVGLSADVAMANTLAEMLTILTIDGVGITDNDDGAVDSATIAFAFNGNTYLATVADDGVADATAANTVTDLIQLTGVTGITAVSTTAAANTILIA